MMTLDEAIAISDEIGKGDTVRAANNRWLAEKLRILKWVEECHVIDEAKRAREEMHGWQTECIRLKAENKSYWNLCKKWFGKAAHLEAENAKLSELVEDMLDYIEIREAFGRPPTSEMYDEFARRADELGIEV